MESEEKTPPGFFARFGLAMKVLGDAVLAGKVEDLIQKEAEPKVAPKALPPERVHASGLFVVATLQQDGRLMDFLQQDVTAFSDEEVGAAAWRRSSRASLGTLACRCSRPQRNHAQEGCDPPPIGDCGRSHSTGVESRSSNWRTMRKGNCEPQQPFLLNQCR